MGMPDDEALIRGCMAGDRNAQNALYRQYASAMLSVCLRYARDQAEAEDIMSEGFVKVFGNIRTYRKDGSFEGWIKRIMINHALNHYRRNRRIPYFEEIGNLRDADLMENESDADSYMPVSADLLLRMVQSLPPGYRMVFNMYVIEGYSHAEIAGMLNISENTSKTQLLKARRQLRSQLQALNLGLNKSGSQNVDNDGSKET